MGLYDTMIGRCPFCERELHMQTKLFRRDLVEACVGEVIDGFMKPTAKFSTRHPCTCGRRPTAVVEAGYFQGFVNTEPEFDE